MAKEQLKSNIIQYIRENGKGEITGKILQEVLISVIDAYSVYPGFGGDAKKVESPKTEDNLFYFATAGTYDQFDGIEVDENELCILLYEGGSWVKETLMTAIPGPKGDKGEKGDTGPKNKLTIGSVTVGEEAGASLDNTEEGQALNLVMEHAKDAYELYRDKTIADGGNPLGKEAWLASLKAQFGSFKSASRDGENNGQPYGVEANHANAQYIWLVNNAAGTRKVIWIAVENSGTYAWQNLGEVDLDAKFASEEELGEVNIDKELTNAKEGDVASAKAVMEIKNSLNSFNLKETGITLSTGEGGNVKAGRVKWIDGSIDSSVNNLTSGSNYTKYSTLEVEIPQGKDRVRFLGFYPKSRDWNFGYAFGYYDDNQQFVPTRIVRFDYDNTLAGHSTKEYVVRIEQGETVLRTTCEVIYKNVTYLSIDDFYCVFQEGNLVKNELDNRLSCNDIDGFWDWRKNLIDTGDLFRGIYVDGQISDTYKDALMSNKLHLVDGVKYAASNVNVYWSSSACKLYIARFREDDSYINTITFDAERTTSINNANKNTGRSVFVYKKGSPDEAYQRVRLRYNATSSDESYYSFTRAQIEIGETWTEYAPYHSERMYFFADKNEIQSVMEKLKHEVYEEVEPNFVSDIGKGICDYRRGKVSTDDGNLRIVLQSGVKYKLFKVNPGEKYYLQYDLPSQNTNSANFAILFVSSEWNDDDSNITGIIYTQPSSDENTYTPPDGVTYIGKKFKITSASGIDKPEGRVEFTIPSDCNVLILNVYNSTAKIERSVMEEYSIAGLQRDIDNLKNSVGKTEINILAIGNSNSQDSLAYVPFLAKTIMPEVNVNIGILMLSSSGIRHHLTNFVNAENSNPPSGYYSDGGVTMYYNGESYLYQYCYSNAKEWILSDTKRTIQWALNPQNTKKWDMILLNISGSYGETSLATFNNLTNKIISCLEYPVAIGVINPATSIAKSNGKFYLKPEDRVGDNNGIPDNSSGRPKTPNELLEGWENSLASTEYVMNNTMSSLVFPVNAAICNALTVDKYRRMGDLSKHINNQSWVDSGDHSKGCYGYLRAPDGVHLQEGLPCQIAAYVVICKLLEYCGKSYRLILGDNSVYDSDFLEDKNIPGAHPDETTNPNEHTNVGTSASPRYRYYTNPGVNKKATAGWTGDLIEDKNRARFGQQCAVMACKYPYEIIDMNYMIVYDVSYTLNNIDKPTIISAPQNSTFTCTLKSKKNNNSYYTIDVSSIIVTMDGTIIQPEITHTIDDSGQSIATIEIVEVTGNIEIMASAS